MPSRMSFTRLLFATFGFICFMIALRIYLTGSLVHLFLIWNIFLGWIPFMLSRYIREYRNRQVWKQLTIFFSWLVFFPNALYIVTDLIHLKDRGGAPVWYDAILLFTCSMMGLLMAYASLYRVEKYLSTVLHRRLMAVTMPAIIFIASFGVYLGRFDRWNSWNIINDPLALAENMLVYIFNPVDNWYMWATTGLFSAFFYILYGYSKWIQQQSEVKP